MMINKLGYRIFFIVLLLAAGFGFYLATLTPAPASPPAGLLWPNPKQLQTFATLDHNNQPFGVQQLNGQWSFVFFGYTYCPDICPLTMAVMNQVYHALIAEHPDIQVIFVSVDPARDTPTKRREYVHYFNKNFIGLGGDAAMIDSLAKQIGIAYQPNQNSDDELIDHTASVFLLSPSAHLVAKLSAPHEKNKLIAQFATIKQFIENNS